MLNVLKQDQLVIRPINQEDLAELWKISYGQKEPEWMKWNGPYFNDPVYSFNEFMERIGPAWVDQPSMCLIEVADEMIGMITWHWEDGKLKKWLEFGLCLYVTNEWNKGIGTQACALWVEHLFQSKPEIQRVGFTTWSANKGMMRIGDKLGMTLEAQIRQVRFYQGVYYDSIKYGILRDEWKVNH